MIIAITMGHINGSNNIITVCTVCVCAAPRGTERQAWRGREQVGGAIIHGVLALAGADEPGPAKALLKRQNIAAFFGVPSCIPQLPRVPPPRSGCRFFIVRPPTSLPARANDHNPLPPPPFSLPAWVVLYLCLARSPLATSWSGPLCLSCVGPCRRYRGRPAAFVRSS
jgi:hypothetical protein